jgi:hypothetical protein
MRSCGNITPTRTPLSVAAPLPTRAIRIRDGDTLISDQFNNRVIRVSPGRPDRCQLWIAAGRGRRDWKQRRLLTPTLRSTDLYSPYDAKVVGDYTGLTPPH